MAIDDMVVAAYLNLLQVKVIMGNALFFRTKIIDAINVDVLYTLSEMMTMVLSKTPTVLESCQC